MRSLRIVSVIAVGLGALVAAMPSAEAATINVSAGQSIQAAIDNAHPGDTIKIGSGTFHEAVSVYKDDLSIIGHNTIIQPPATAEFGLCISAYLTCWTSTPSFVDGDSVSGITVQKSLGFGFVDVYALDSALTQDTATGNEEDGFDVEESADAVLTSDQASGNSAGFAAENVGEITLRNSIFKFNCIGVAVIAAENIEISNNIITGNTKACAAEGPLPTTKGLGAFVDETETLQFTHNALQGNGKATSSQSTGGLVIIGTYPGYDNVYTANALAKNLPVDIRADSAAPGFNSFANNACSISVPSGLC